MFARNVLLISSLLLMSNAHAADSNNDSNWNLGLAITTQQSPFIDGDARQGIRPIRLSDNPFKTQGISLPLTQTEQHKVYIGLGLDEWDHKRGDSPALADMKELDRAVNVRIGAATKINQRGIASIDIAQDVAGAHKGTQAKLRYTHVPQAKTIQPYAELQWLSSDVSDYYVGVDASEVKANRPAYQADDALAVKAGMNIEHAINKRTTLIGGVDVTHYDKAISDSPIIEEDTIWGANIGVAYEWK